MNSLILHYLTDISGLSGIFCFVKKSEFRLRSKLPGLYLPKTIQGRETMRTTIGWKSGMRIWGACALLVCGAWGQAKNTLTQEEEAAGYKLLFNGTNLDGWRSYNNTTPPASWQVVAESTWKVLYIQSGSPTSSLITTDATYRNFDFMVEWNIASNGNSGIFIRYNKHNVDQWGGASGPEAQIGATNNSDATAPKFRAGTCYDMFPLLDKAKTWDGTPNYGKWHQFRIIAYEGHVAHYGNGIKLLEYVIRSPAWNSAYNASKYAAYPDYATVHPGSIYLQHHGEFGPEAPRFRNIRIKKLTENPWAVGSAYLANPTTPPSLKDLTFANLILEKTIQSLRRCPRGRARHLPGGRWLPHPVQPARRLPDPHPGLAGPLPFGAEGRERERSLAARRSRARRLRPLHLVRGHQDPLRSDSRPLTHHHSKPIGVKS